MSQPAGKRNKGTLGVITLSGNLCDYTLQITSKEEHFPKRYRWCISNRIVQTAIDIDDRLIHANAVYVREGDGSFERRQRLQLEALELTYVLLRNIDRAYRRFGPGSFNVEHWAGLIDELQKSIRGWYTKEKEKHDKTDG